MFDSQELSDGDDRRHARKKSHLVKGGTKSNFLYDRFKKWKMELSGTVGEQKFQVLACILLLLLFK